MLLGNSLLKHGVSTPVSIVATSGSGQSANCGAQYTNPLVATITPALSGISVTFTAPATGPSGTFASTGTRTETVLSNGSGVATSSTLTANTIAGANFTVTATTGALTANFSETNVETWANYIPNVVSPLTTVETWWRMRDTSGTNVANSGSLGSALDLTAIAWTMNQAGQLGAGEAGLTDGATTRLQTANNATLAGRTTWEWVFLVKPSGAGESALGAFFVWGDGANEPFLLFNSGTTSLIITLFNTLNSGFSTTTTSGLVTTAFQLLFVAYDNAGDRKVHFYKGVSGSVSELGYSAQNAMTGTYKAPTSALNIFNRSLQDRTFAGLGDEVLRINGNLTPTQRSTLCTLSGV